MAGIHAIDEQSERPTLEYVEHPLKSALTDAGAVLVAYFVSETRANNFPALPVRVENVLVWFAGFPEQTPDGDAPAGRCEPAVSMPHAPGVARPMQVLRLHPPAPSTLTGPSPASPAT